MSTELKDFVKKTIDLRNEASARKSDPLAQVIAGILNYIHLGSVLQNDYGDAMLHRLIAMVTIFLEVESGNYSEYLAKLGENESRKDVN